MNLSGNNYEKFEFENYTGIYSKPFSSHWLHSRRNFFRPEILSLIGSNFYSRQTELYLRYL